jgi:hypothetical protein
LASFSASVLGTRGSRHGVALGLQLGDGLLQLRDGGADVGQLDDVGLGLERQRAEFGEVVGDALVGRQRSAKAARMRPATEMSRVSTG